MPRPRMYTQTLPPSSVPPPPLVGCPSRTLGSHTTGSSHALVRPDVSTSLGTCLALLRSDVSTIGNSWAIVRADALRTSRLHHRHLLWAPGSHIIGTGRAMVLAAGCMKKVSPFQTLDATFGCLAHHRQQLRHGPRGCLDQPPHMPCAATGSCLAHHRQQLGHGPRGCLDQPRLGAQNCLGTCLDLGGQLAPTPSAPAGPWCMRMAVRKKCPNFRHSMLRAPASHTIGCNFDMVRADTSNSLGTCLALLQASGSHSIRSNCDMV